LTIEGNIPRSIPAVQQPKAAVTAGRTESRKDSLLSQTARFARDFAAHAGRKGVVAIVFVALGALLESVGLVLVVPIAGVAIDADTAPSWARNLSALLFAPFSAESQFQKLAVLLGLFVLLMTLRAIVFGARDVTLAELQFGFVEAQRAGIIRRLAATRWDIVTRLRHARIAHLMSSDIQGVGMAAYALLQCGIAAVMLIGQGVLAFLLSPLLACIVLCLVIAGGIALAPMLRRSRDLGSFVTNANLSLMNSMVQFLGALKLAVSQNLQDSFLTEFQETMRGLTRRQIEFIRRRAKARLAISIISGLTVALAVLIGFGVLRIAPAVLIALLLVLTRMMGPATQIQLGAQQFVQSLPAYEKVKELEAELVAVAGREAVVAGAGQDLPDGPVVFSKVGFRHPNADEQSSEAGVRDLNLVIEPGSFVGISGPSGAGKTTFADLLAGLYPPQMGSITIAGRPLDGATVTQWRNRISYVSQDPFLFHDTVRRNLLWANPGAREQELWDALRFADAENVVKRMERGMETVMGERGSLVSGGERQRLALARALLRKPRLLVLDEATNAIDIGSERDILERIAAMKSRPTVVMIAHRAESLNFCDRVLVLENGTFAG
jgi:ATP-binding cassette subfamily C protein